MLAEHWALGLQCTSLTQVGHQEPTELTMTCVPLDPGALLPVVSRSGGSPDGPSLTAPHLIDFTTLPDIYLYSRSSMSFSIPHGVAVKIK